MKFIVDYTSDFKKQFKKIKKQGKDLKMLYEVIKLLANGQQLDSKCRNHKLINDKYYKNCYECHIAPDWLLVYRYEEKELILLLMNTGSHSELFGK